MKRTKRFGLLLALACTPARGEAQALWDSTALAALFAGHRPAGQSGGYREDWFQAAQGGVIVGAMAGGVLGLVIGARRLQDPRDHPRRRWWRAHRAGDRRRGGVPLTARTVLAFFVDEV